MGFSATDTYVVGATLRVARSGLVRRASQTVTSGRVRPDRQVSESGQRFYNPNLGRWLSRDPIEEDGGLNIYAYCINSPANGIDALGEGGTFPAPPVPIPSPILPAPPDPNPWPWPVGQECCEDVCLLDGHLEYLPHAVPATRAGGRYADRKMVFVFVRFKFTQRTCRDVKLWWWVCTRDGDPSNPNPPNPTDRGPTLALTDWSFSYASDGTGRDRAHVTWVNAWRVTVKYLSCEGRRYVERTIVRKASTDVSPFMQTDRRVRVHFAQLGAQYQLMETVRFP
jgi:RHS repeat-associated protein